MMRIHLFENLRGYIRIIVCVDLDAAARGFIPDGDHKAHPDGQTRRIAQLVYFRKPALVRTEAPGDGI